MREGEPHEARHLGSADDRDAEEAAVRPDPPELGRESRIHQEVTEA